MHLLSHCPSNTQHAKGDIDNENLPTISPRNISMADSFSKGRSHGHGMGKEG
jgi:hypothetical protein